MQAACCWRRRWWTQSMTSAGQSTATGTAATARAAALSTTARLVSPSPDLLPCLWGVNSGRHTPTRTAASQRPIHSVTPRLRPPPASLARDMFRELPEAHARAGCCCAGICCHFCRQKKLCGEEGCHRCIQRNPDLPCIGVPICHTYNVTGFHILSESAEH